MNREQELQAFCLWLLTMDAREADMISKLTKPFREDKMKVSHVTVEWWRAKK